MANQNQCVHAEVPTEYLPPFPAALHRHHQKQRKRRFRQVVVLAQGQCLRKRGVRPT